MFSTDTERFLRSYQKKGLKAGWLSVATNKRQYKTILNLIQACLDNEEGKEVRVQGISFSQSMDRF